MVKANILDERKLRLKIQYTLSKTWAIIQNTKIYKRNNSNKIQEYNFTYKAKKGKPKVPYYTYNLILYKICIFSLTKHLGLEKSKTHTTL